MERGLGRGRRLSQGQSLRSLGPDEPVQRRSSQSSTPVHEPSFASFFSQSIDDVYEPFKVREEATPEGGESGSGSGRVGRYSVLGEPRNAPLELAAAADDVRRQAAEAQEASLREAREKMSKELEREKQEAREEMERQTDKYNRMVSEVQLREAELALREEDAAAKAQELQRKVADAEKRERDAEERDKEAQRKICEAEQRGREADEKARETERKAQAAEGKMRKYKESRDAAKEKAKEAEAALELQRTQTAKERTEERKKLVSLRGSLAKEKEVSARLRSSLAQLKGFGKAIVAAADLVRWELGESEEAADGQSGGCLRKISDKQTKESKQSGQGKSGKKGDRDTSPPKEKTSGKVSLKAPLPQPDPTSGFAPSTHHPSPQPQKEDQGASAHDQKMAWCFGETGFGEDEDVYGPADPANLDLNPHLMANWAELGWGQMTAFQKRLVSVLLKVQDLVATGPKDSGMMTT